MSRQVIELTESEWTIIKAVWDNEPWARPAIREKLHKRTEWTCSTVRTLQAQRTKPETLRRDWCLA